MVRVLLTQIRNKTVQTNTSFWVDQSANRCTGFAGIYSISAHTRAHYHSATPNKNVLVEYLREFNEEKDKSICKLSKADLKVFSIISNGKCVNGVPYTDPSQFMSALCAFSRDLGVIYYPAKCKGIFSFDFG